MVSSHTCIVDPDSIGYVGYLRERKLALCDGNCRECGVEILRAFVLIHNSDEMCKEEGCCRLEHDSNDETEGCTPNPDTVGPFNGDAHNLVWSCINCDCWGVVGEASGTVYEDEEGSVEFWSGGVFKTQ
jgi:hypothetical protein